ncbi:HtaA domain-containing protein [Conyzicola nivalis]|uniref:HtaA domain-containing protein n=1 Tax=Conyzicola nivalis TaxID=1477021 RepID=UPI0016660585|nr:HtaA domain-containing protein [Conyzicola nivalis]
MNTATRISSSARALLAALLTTLLVVSGVSLGAQPASAATGEVTSATLSWGIKQSFRTYIKSPIAKGTWTIAGNVTDTTPFAWTGGAGTASQSASTGSVGYTGSIHFQGHEGVGVPAGSYGLDLTISDVRVKQTSATAAQVVVDVYSNSLDAPTTFVQSNDVVFATVDLAAAAAASTATTVAYSAAPTVLTPEGASAFAGFYEPGTALDPVSFSWPVEQASQPAVATSTALAVPAAATIGTAVTLSATVTPAGAVGSVGFFDGATSLATAPVASGTASTSSTFSVAGAHPITAVFTPTDPAAFVSSTSAASPVTVSAAPVATVPTVVVSKSVVSAAGETITVTGSGFSPVGAATSAARPPLAGKFGGVYVTFGKFADVWKASAGATSSARTADRSTLKWVVNPADVATVGGAAAGAVAINADGTFSIDMLVKPGFTGEPATGNYGIYTYPGGGVAYPAFETATPITFATTPKVTVSKSTLTSAGEQITVTGSGFSPVGAATNATRPPLAGKFGGVYVTFGKFASTWKASAGAASSARTADRSTLKWVMNPADVATVGGAAAGAVPINADGTFSIDMLVKPGFTGEPASGNYGIYTYPGGGVTYPAFETATPITFTSGPNAPAPTSLGLTANPATVTAGAATALIAKVSPVAAGTVTFTSGGATVGVVPVGADGTATQVTPPIAAGTTTYTATFAPTDPLVYVGSTNAVTVTATAPVPSTASLDWGVKKSFRDYILSPTAHGTITTAGVTDNGGSYSFPATTGGSYDATTGVGASFYTGSVHFSGHDGVLDIEFGNPSVRLTSATAGTLSVSVGGGAPVAIANLDLGSATTSSTATSKSFVAAPATLTAAGATAFGGFYLAGTSLDPVSFTIDTTVPADPNAPTEPEVPTQPEVPVPPYVAPPSLAPIASPASLAAGSLTWGVKQSFRDYVTGSIAKGAVTTSGVASSGGSYTFGQAAGGTFDRASGVGSSNYSGSVRFTGHAGQLDVTLGDPVVRVDSASSGTLLVSVNGGASTPFATLDLAAGSRSTPNNAVSYSGVPASLTSQGAAVFSLNGSGFYAVGTPLDPVSFVIGAPNVVSNTVGATVASFKAPNTAAPTPPATTGIEVAQGTTLNAGDEVTITASGFRPNETGILVVIYSTPMVLDTNATADASGVVTWTGRLPAGLSGVHTLTLQGSVDRGVELTIAAAELATAVAGCVVDDATLTWGFKESFRAYISGSIANGEWTVADGATYAVPDFGWTAGTGGYDAESGEGQLAFAGSIAFTGHSGVLNTTVANPQIRFVDESSALLLLDVSGTTQDGAVVDNKAVEFAELDLTGVLENEGGAVTITAAPATLTDAGAAAFGTYPAGEALDPVTVAFTTAADCAVPVEEAAAAATTADVDTVSDENPIDYGWVVWLIAALLVIAAAVVVVVRLRRRKA